MFYNVKDILGGAHEKHVMHKEQECAIDSELRVPFPVRDHSVATGNEGRMQTGESEE